MTITDDSGILALVDPDAYEGFVDEDWTWESINAHFVRAMHERTLLVWGAGMEHDWRVGVRLESAADSGFREIVGTINVSKGRLLATSYDSLTMAAQFRDQRLPQDHEQNNIVSVPAGVYQCRVIQVSDPDSDEPFSEKINFIYEIVPGEHDHAPWTSMPWSPL